MSIFTKLGKYIVLNLLQEWLNLVEIGQLDKAVCSNNERTVFLKYVSTEETRMFHGLNSTNVDDSLIAWLCARCIKVDSMKLDLDLFSEDTKSIVLSFSTHLKQIVSDHCKPHHAYFLVSLFAKATHLTEVKFTD